MCAALTPARRIFLLLRCSNEHDHGRGDDVLFACLRTICVSHTAMEWAISGRQLKNANRRHMYLHAKTYLRISGHLQMLWPIWQ
ncbi:hypothetical protein [Meleagrid alphaherpesvirus 1]|uniref:Uncharacterized protein HVT068 n=1 Tax=Meleagrid herpesvirus 1 TaxID=37108 RepID=Q9DPP7_MEHV1|nr:hypothetical protein [Meleagrid alphaherpesvirus 1]